RHFTNTPPTSRILPVSSLLVGTGVHDRHPGKCGAGSRPVLVTRAAPVPMLACAPAPPAYRKGMDRARQREKRRRRMAARQLDKLEDVAAMRRFPHPGFKKQGAGTISRGCRAGEG